MGNLKKDFELIAGNEQIEFAVIGPDRDDDYGVPKDKQNVVLLWEEAAPLLDRDYDSGYGGADCNPVTAWTKNKVLWVAEYDGATGVNWIPRDPVDHKPEHSGIS